MERIKVIGAGLAGCEAAYRAAKEGFKVTLYEMRPSVMTPAHTGGGFAELVCSNSLKSTDLCTAQGVLKREMKLLDSLIIEAAEATAVPAGGALAVDREKFSLYIENKIKSLPEIEVVRAERTEIDDYTVIAAGPLASAALTEELKKVTGGEYLNFFDAVAPIVTKESIDFSKAFYAGRYGKGGEDYLNCPMDAEEYYTFCEELVSAEKVVLREFEKKDVFNACMPVEIMAAKGKDTLRFGPLRPVGLTDPTTGKRPFSVVQLRKEDERGSMWNIVGFQTNLKFTEQKRVFSLIPALKNAEFARYGVMHRNTFVNAPKVLGEGFSLAERPKVFLCGQLSGVEGYAESAASGIIAGINVCRVLKGQKPVTPPETTAIGGLMKYITSPNEDFQPMHVGFPLMGEPITGIKDKTKRKAAYSERAERDFAVFKENL